MKRGSSAWGVAAFGLAAALLDGLEDALGFAAEPVLAAEVEDLGLAAEDGGDDPGVGGQAPGLSGGEGFAGVEVGCFEAAHERVEGYQDHDGGVEAAGRGAGVLAG